MNEFNLKYQTDPDFRNFINDILDFESGLWYEYTIIKSYDMLLDNEEDIKIKPEVYAFMLNPIDEMINYFQSTEEYEKCNNLKRIKNIITI